MMSTNRRTNGPTNHVFEHPAKEAETSAILKNKGGDSIAIQAIATTTGRDSAPSTARRLSRLQLGALKERLSERDLLSLQAIQKYRFINSGQIQELYYTNGSTEAANVRATNKAMKKLRDYGLIKPLERRIGGVRAGSSALVWHLTEPGERLLNLESPKDRPRKRFEEPSQAFLAHTLAVTDYAKRLTTFCREQPQLSIATLEPEPACWRPYTADGKTQYLKPDLYAVLSSGEFEYQFYFEIDLGTEPMPKLMKKCQTYLDYYYSGEDQKKSGLFPLVVWVVPDEGRKQKLTEKIEENFSNKAQIFKTKLAEDNPQELLL